MNKGCTKEDYNVSIGEGQCQIEQLLDNELLCLPPDNAPTQTPNEEHLGKNKYYLLVQVGYGAVHQVGVVRYYKDDTVLYVIIGCSVTAVVIIILAIIACVLISKRYKQRLTEERTAGDDEVLEEPLGLNHIGSAINTFGSISEHDGTETDDLDSSIDFQSRGQHTTALGQGPNVRLGNRQGNDQNTQLTCGMDRGKCVDPESKGGYEQPIGEPGLTYNAHGSQFQPGRAHNLIDTTGQGQQ